ncbi:PAP1-domain-containing protein [Rhizophagus clarus]|uniref:PAP1-domain-containing protein n=1 Tax=Rhizophagus clarus TaxID=94130 RepID=A0A8H3MIC1_9GLOM|nr:PAP1-domain-containing protein [Rhizophagus clarus]
MSDRSLPQRFRLPLPKPINDVIPCQQTLNLHPIGKPMPNRRGRKPLSTMPLGKKHVQNLTNQRAFRQRKENYIRNLEIKASQLEMLYNSAQNEIKTLNDRITILEKRLASSRSIRSEAIKNVNNRDPNTHYGGIVDSAIYQAIMDNHTIYDENKDGPCDVIMNDQISKDSDLFCDPITTSDERIWIASTNTPTSSSLYPTFVASNPSQGTRENGPTFPPPQDSESQWIQPYFSQASTTITTASHHRLNLKWILSDAPNEE